MKSSDFVVNMLKKIIICLCFSSNIFSMDERNKIVVVQRITDIPANLCSFWSHHNEFYYRVQECGSLEVHLEPNEKNSKMRKNSCFFRAVHGALSKDPSDPMPFHQDVYFKIKENLSLYSNPILLAETSFFQGLVGDLLITLQDEHCYEGRNPESGGVKIYKFEEKYKIYKNLLKEQKKEDLREVVAYYNQLTKDLALDYIEKSSKSIIFEYVDLFFLNNFPVSIGVNEIYGKYDSLPVKNMIDTVAHLYGVNIEVFSQAYEVRSKNEFRDVLQGLLRNEKSSSSLNDIIETVVGFYDPKEPECFLSCDNVQSLKEVVAKNYVWLFLKEYGEEKVTLDSFLLDVLRAHHQMYIKRNVLLKSIGQKHKNNTSLKLFYNNFHWQALLLQEKGLEIMNANQERINKMASRNIDTYIKSLYEKLFKNPQN